MPAKREVIERKGDKRYARGDKEGQFTNDQTSVGKSFPAESALKGQEGCAERQGDRETRKNASRGLHSMIAI